MHDGQNLFDPATSFAGDWGLVGTLNELGAEGVEAIVVGIPNRGRRRRSEYSPFRDLLHGGGGGERYLGFLVETVKPLVDASFRTRPERTHTVIAGSSLGGLISLYALYRHAGIFGAASVQSPALWFARRAIFRYLERHRGPPAGGARIHLDVGSEEGVETLADARRLRDVLVSAGYVAGRDLSYVEEAGAGHTEAAWGRRFREALPFLLGKRE
jgi:predicted alpha/beta superfamily hydrolase